MSSLKNRLNKLESASPKNQQVVEVHFCNDNESIDQATARLELPAIDAEDNVLRIFVDFTP